MFADDFLFHICCTQISSPISSQPLSISPSHPHPLVHDFKTSSVELGPRVLLCADLAVNLLLKSTANQYVEFKNIDASYIGDGNGNLTNVPDSKSAVFKDKTLKYSEKNQLNSFFKLVQGHLEAVKSVGVDVDDGNVISDEDLESPFVVFLDKMKFPPKIKSIILYAIAMADYDQDGGESCKDILRTRDGIDQLALYHSSVGRFPNALGALIYPIYGQGELPQAFCRCAAVKGCLYVDKSLQSVEEGAERIYKDEHGLLLDS